ncbi:MAG: hypothetical protein MUC49_22800, partial [Raineya sp.]|nr:hypothetical protein [Raineya sp.]
MAIRSIKSYEKDITFRALPLKNDPRFKNDLHKYAIHFMSSMLNSYTNGRTEVKYNSPKYEIMDLYFKGLQGNTVVKEKLLRKDKNGKFYGRMKDVFDNIDILPEMLDIVAAINSRSDYALNSYAVDGVSKEAKKLEMSISKFLVNSNTKRFLKFMQIKPNTTLTEEEIATFNEADIDVIYETGGIQLPVEIQAIAACNVSKLLSGHKEVEDQCTEDLIKWAIT